MWVVVVEEEEAAAEDSVLVDSVLVLLVVVVLVDVRDQHLPTSFLKSGQRGRRHDMALLGR